MVVQVVEQTMPVEEQIEQTLVLVYRVKVTMVVMVSTVAHLKFLMVEVVVEPEQQELRALQLLTQVVMVVLVSNQL